MAEATPTTPTNSSAAPAAQPASPQPTPAASAPSLLGAEPTPAGGEQQMPEGFEGGAEAWGKLDDAARGALIAAADVKAKADSAARTDAFAKAEGKDAKVAAFKALTKDEQIAAFKGLKEADRKELGIEDPEIPQYGEFKLPEGFTKDDKLLGEATQLFKDARLPQESAQKFIDFHANALKETAQRGVQAYNDLQTKWQSDVMADPEIGGQNWEASKAAVDRLMDRLNIPDLKGALNLTGAGNHPAVVKALVRVAKMTAEDKLLTGQSARTPEPKSPSQVIYGDPPAAS